jgi:hypothetical protein
MTSAQLPASAWRRTQKALASIKAPVLYMPSETDLYFPVGDARYECAVHSTLHSAAHPFSVGTSPPGPEPVPEDEKFPQRAHCFFPKGTACPHTSDFQFSTTPTFSVM